VITYMGSAYPRRVPTPLENHLAEQDFRVQKAYESSQEDAAKDPQRSGHVAEATWEAILSAWLPAGYSVGRRKYIVPELGDDEFETDLVVFRPSVPLVMQEATQVPHGAIAAAFFVRRTAERSGLEDAVTRAVRLRRAMDRKVLQRHEVFPAYPIGFLGLGHGWRSEPAEAIDLVTQSLMELDSEHASVPSESLDLCCIGSLGSWSRFRVPNLPGVSLKLYTGVVAPAGCPGTVLISSMGESRVVSPNPVGHFVRDLYSALEGNDHELAELAYSFRKGVPTPSGSAPIRFWLDWKPTHTA
jgi:hypothetical protein